MLSWLSSIFYLPSSLIASVVAVLALVLCTPVARADDDVDPQFRAHFLQLCDLVAAKVGTEQDKNPYFADSYGIRTLCAAYDMTGKEEYLDACRRWADLMVKYQGKMVPEGAYYMHYNRKPGATTGDWFAADSSSIGMAVVATAVRCHGADRKRYLQSAEKFAGLVIKNYVKPSGGVSDGLWSKSSDEWWCSSGLFGSFTFVLYKNTGDKQYLHTGLGIVNWLNNWDLTKPQPFPLSQQGPAMLMYTMECYSAGWPYISKDEQLKTGARAKVLWCLNWMLDAQQKPITQGQAPAQALGDSESPGEAILQGPWPLTKWWGMKFGGLPFHEYIFSRNFSDDSLRAAGDAELQRLAPVAFAKIPPEMNQLTMFMMMSYAERLDPGAIYRSKKHWHLF